jgi:hypothetical protein
LSTKKCASRSEERKDEGFDSRLNELGELIATQDQFACGLRIVKIGAPIEGAESDKKIRKFSTDKDVSLMIATAEIRTPFLVHSRFHS